MYKYHYSYRLTSFDLWQLNMYYIYGSLIGVCNAVFTAAVFVLAYVKWFESGFIFRLLLIVGCCLFTVIQPVVIYRRARIQAAASDCCVELGFDDGGMMVKTAAGEQCISWKQVRKVSIKPTMIIIFTGAAHGYVLMNRILGADRKEFAEYIRERLINTRS